MPKPDSRGALLDWAAQVAWRFCAYDAYGRSESTALRAIRRKFPTFTERQHANALRSALALYDATQKAVREIATALWDEFHRRSSGEIDKLVNVLRTEFPSFRVSTIRGLINMTFYYWHMR